MIDQGYQTVTASNQRVLYIGQCSNSTLFPAGHVLMSPIDVSNYTSIIASTTVLSGGTTISVEISTNGGASYSTLANILATGDQTINLPQTAGQTSGLIRVTASTAATSGSTFITFRGTVSDIVTALPEVIIPSVVPYSSTALSAANSVLVGPYWAGNQRSGLIHITSTASGATLQIQLSNDTFNWYAASNVTIAGTPSQASSLNSTGAYGFSINGALYIRVVTTTAITSGTLTFTLSLSSSPGFFPQNSAQNITPIASSGVANMVSIVTAASNNLQNLKTSNACVTGIFGTGAASGKTCYLKMFNSASVGGVNFGVTVPLLNIGIAHPHSASFDCSLGLRFGTGLTIAITANAALLDTTATSAGDGVWNITWA